MRPFLFLATLLTATATTVEVTAGDQRFATGDNRVSLVELYTSEGCSSCPPAERRLSELKNSPGLWRDFVPVAFHVNYWDRLGWPDRFATREATQREHGYAAVWGRDSVYTPCFVRDGAEWRGATFPPPSSREKTGALVVTVSPAGDCRVEFSPAEPRAKENFEVYVALLGSGFRSHVTAGENRGETLRHEFVVIGFEKHPLENGATGAHTAAVTLPRTKIYDAPQRALAVWISRKGELAPVQATGGWLQ